MDAYRVGAAGKNTSGQDRWMVWAPDHDEPERLTVGHCVPSLQQVEFAIALCRRLNKDANEGGTWLVSWSRPDVMGVPTRLAMAWVDKDGDAPFTIDTEEPIAVLQRAGADHYALQGYDALLEYHEHLKATEVSSKQMIRQRAGEQVKDPRQLVPWNFG